MATTVKHKRGTAAQVAAYLGPQGEVVMDTTNNRLSLQDGATAGGVVIPKMSDVTTAAATAQANAIAAIPATPTPFTNSTMLAQVQALALCF